MSLGLTRLLRVPAVARRCISASSLATCPRRALLSTGSRLFLFVELILLGLRFIGGKSTARTASRAKPGDANSLAAGVDLAEGVMTAVSASDDQRGDDLAKDVARFGREVVATSAAAARSVGRIAVLVDTAGDDGGVVAITDFLGVGLGIEGLG